jgi:predicted O-methyltransferase YrrM
MARYNIVLDDKLYPYFQKVACDEAPVLAELRDRTASLPLAVMQISPEQGAFMAMMVRLTGARRILEIGTFTGYSSLAMAMALPPDGMILASDVSEEWTSIAREFWAKAGVSNRISLVLKPGREVIADLMAKGEAGSFDMMFIDADKEQYDAYYEGGLKLLKTGGLMLIDNVLWGGDVANPEKTDADTEAFRALNAKIRKDARVDFSMVPIGDGVTMVHKR